MAKLFLETKKRKTIINNYDKELRSLSWPYRRDWIKLFKHFEINAPFLKGPFCNEKFCKKLQKRLQGLCRWNLFWGHYMKSSNSDNQKDTDPKNAPMRIHNVTEHTHSFYRTGEIILGLLQNKVEIDNDLFLETIIVHDWGEGLNNKDVPSTLKNNSHDLKEYLVVRKLLENHFSQDGPIFIYYHKAFLLQFVADFLDNQNEFSAFPKDAIGIIKKLSKKKN